MVKITGFDANEVEPQGVFEPIPEGKYLATIIDSDNKATANGNGSYLELKFQIIEGEHKNRTLFSRLNLENPSQQAVNIAKAQLSAICRAVNVFTPQDSVELHNKPLLISVKVITRKDNGNLTNEIKGYEAEGQQAEASASTTPEAKPWGRK